MTDRLAPAAVHETLDREGLLDDARGAGTYALRLDVPDAADEAARRWLAVHSVTPGEDALERLAAADRVAYVGAARCVYDRLEDHAAGDVRKAAFLQPFPPVDVVGVWPADDPFAAEHSRAYTLAGEGWTVVVNGEVI